MPKKGSRYSAGKMERSTRRALAAYQLRPTEPQALRAVARFSRAHAAGRADFWKQLRSFPSPSRAVDVAR